MVSITNISQWQEMFHIKSNLNRGNGLHQLMKGSINGAIREIIEIDIKMLSEMGLPINIMQKLKKTCGSRFALLQVGFHFGQTCNTTYDYIILLGGANMWASK